MYIFNKNKPRNENDLLTGLCCRSAQFLLTELSEADGLVAVQCEVLGDVPVYVVNFNVGQHGLCCCQWLRRLDTRIVFFEQPEKIFDLLFI